jgi:hypothetical protein
LTDTPAGFETNPLKEIFMGILAISIYCFANSRVAYRLLSVNEVCWPYWFHGTMRPRGLIYHGTVDLLHNVERTAKNNAIVKQQFISGNFSNINVLLCKLQSGLSFVITISKWGVSTPLVSWYYASSRINLSLNSWFVAYSF